MTGALRTAVLRLLVMAAVLAGALGVVVPAQAPPDALPSAKILSPQPNSFATGTVVLSATADVSAPVEYVTFFVDGRQVCVVSEHPFECTWDAGTDVVAHQVRAVFNLPEGERVARSVRTKGLGFADKVNVEVVQVTVTVTDDNGHFIPGIPQSAFRVSEDGKPQSITYFASEAVPLELIVAVDVSGSMTPAIGKLKTAVKEFLGAVPSDDRVTLLGFNDSIFALTRKTTKPADRVKAVDRIAPWGATALYDVVMRGVDMLGTQQGRKALVIFTDGEDQGSHVAIEEVERRLQSSDVTLYMIAQGRGLTQENLRKVMQRLVLPTGGRFFATESVDELQATFGELLDELSNQYLLGYPPTNSVRDDTWREITVEVENHTGVRARQGYRATPYQ